MIPTPEMIEAAARALEEGLGPENFRRLTFPKQPATTRVILADIAEAALTAALSAAWRPIESAPRDGKTKIILGAWHPEDRSIGTVAVLALEPLDSDQGDTTKPRAIFGLGAIFYPTHWQHLPSPPMTHKSEESE